WSYEGNIALRQDRISQNVILTIPGQSESLIIVGAHYDSYLSAGANDNASGVVLLLESAYRMKNADNYHTIMYVFFGAEEVGLWGARYFYDSLTQQERDKIALMINVDGIVSGNYLMYSAARGEGPGFEALPFLIDSIAADIESQMTELYEQMGIEMLLTVTGLAGMGIESVEQLIEVVVAINSDIPPVAVLYMWQAIPTPVTVQIDAIVAQLGANTELVGLPNGMITPTDQIVFLMEGHTVLYFASLTRISESNMEFLLAQENELFGHFIHTASDTFEYIEATNPGMMQNNLRVFSLLLEEILLAEFIKY
ncbi:MAG: M28 family metallopeptidase, partial [Defluviitaleaceae bacterium]|nr:M28 family metallopeptidase [Defluviitaleaceae bacterium]